MPVSLKWLVFNQTLECGPMPDVMAALPNIGQLLECRTVSLPRRETRWNLQGCPKLVNRSQPLVGRSWPYYQDMWRRYWFLTSFFPIVDTYLSCEDIARQSRAMVPRGQFFDDFLRPVFSASRVQHVSDLHLKVALRPHHGSMVYIQATTAEIRRGKKERRNHRAKI